MGYGPGQRRGPGKLLDFQRSPTSGSRMVHASRKSSKGSRRPKCWTRNSWTNSEIERKSARDRSRCKWSTKDRRHPAWSCRIRVGKTKAHLELILVSRMESNKNVSIGTSSTKEGLEKTWAHCWLEHGKWRQKQVKRLKHSEALGAFYVCLYRWVQSSGFTSKYIGDTCVSKSLFWCLVAGRLLVGSILCSLLLLYYSSCLCVCMFLDTELKRSLFSLKKESTNLTFYVI